MEFSKENKVSEIATKCPKATKVFFEYEIDFCCGGNRSLEKACLSKGIDVETLLLKLKEETTVSEKEEKRWDLVSLEELIAHIVTDYHRPLDKELPRLEAMAKKVLAVHQEKAPDVLPKLVATFVELKRELEDHMMKEEEVLFKMILHGNYQMTRGPISVMLTEHDSAADALESIKKLTNNYQAPEGACNTWTALWNGLKELELELKKHIHLENNILFSRVKEKL